MYLKLGVPGLIAILIEWSNVEIGGLAAGNFYYRFEPTFPLEF
jgi:hypothetical protein